MGWFSFGKTYVNREESIADKLRRGDMFGLFDDGMVCYFQDGYKVSYTKLWIVLRQLNNINGACNKSLDELCPTNFVGAYSYKYSRHKWQRPTAMTTSMPNSYNSFTNAA